MMGLLSRAIRQHNQRRADVEIRARRLFDLAQRQADTAYFNAKCRASGNPHLCRPLPKV